MTPTQAAIKVRAQLLAQMLGTKYALPIMEAAQPNKQGRVADGIYYQMLNPRNTGTQKRAYDVDDKTTTVIQHYETMIQITCFVSDDDVRGYDSADLAAVVQMHMQTLRLVSNLRTHGIGIQHPTAIRSLEFQDERGNYAVEASFDVNLTYSKEMVMAQDFIDTLTPETIGTF